MTDTQQTSELTMWNTDCVSCDAHRSELQKTKGDIIAALMTRMILCPECGNKRCPKATHHDNACTGSNEPGQVGSVYGFVTFPENLTGDPKINI